MQKSRTAHGPTMCIKGNSEEGHRYGKCFSGRSQHRREKRTRSISLFNMIGIIGNILVLLVFRKRVNVSSNYRVCVVFLSVVDLFTCVAVSVKEIQRMRSVYNQASTDFPFRCKFFHYIGNSVTLSSLFFATFIAFEMYMKICKPLKPQITSSCTKLMCACVIFLSLAVSFPIYLIHGRRYVAVESINATRCAIENKYDEDLLPILYYNFVLFVSLISIVLTVILYIRIRTALVKKGNLKQRRKCIISTLTSEPDQERGKHKTAAIDHDQETERNKRIAFRFAFISMFLIIGVATHKLFHVGLVARRYFYPRQTISKLEDVVEEYLPDIVAVNGILNPFVYLFTDIEFKEELMKLCGRKI